MADASRRPPAESPKDDSLHDDSLHDDSPHDDSPHDEELSRLLRDYVPVVPRESFRRRSLLELREAERGRRSLRDARRTWWPAVAAVALFALVWAVAGRLGDTSDVQLHADAPVWIAASDGPWLLRDEGALPSEGAEIAVVRERGARVVWRGTQLELPGPSWIRTEAFRGDATPEFCVRAGVVEARTVTPVRLRLPIGSVRGEHARFRVAITHNEEDWNGKDPPDMKRWIAGGAVVAAVVVTIMVWDSEEPVVVTGPAGEEHSLVAGESATLRPDAPVEVTSSTVEVESEAPVEAEAPIERTTIVGRVVDTAGDPVPDVRVVLRRAAEAAEGEDPGDGEWATSSLEAGEFELSVPIDVESGWLLAHATYRESESVEWGRQDETEEYTLVVRAVTTIAGVVRLPDAEPATDFIVALHPTAEWAEPILRPFESPDGSFIVRSIPAGGYRVLAYQAGYQRSEPVRVDVAEGQVRDGVEIDLVPGRRASGTVFVEGTGEPVEGAIVFVPKGHLLGSINVLSRSEFDGRLRDAAMTDRLGRFELSDLPDGPITVRAIHPEFVPAEGIATEGEPVELAMKSGTGIRGTVLDEDGRAIEGASVFVTLFTPGSTSSGVDSGITKVDSQGRYYVPNLTPGSYIVVLLLEEDLNDEEPEVSYTRVSPEKDSELDFILKSELATLKGRITNGAGQPFPGLIVNAASTSGTEFTFRSGYTDAEGNFEILNLELDRAYSISAGPGPGRFGVVDMITFTEPIDYDRAYTFKPLKIQGTVKDEDGEPVRAELIVLSPVEGIPQFAGMSASGEDGGFVSMPGREGSFSFLVTAPGYQRHQSATVELEGQGDPPTIDIVLERGASVEVRVVDGKGKPIPGALVNLIDDRGRPRNVGLPPRADGQGVYRYGSLKKGGHIAQVSVEGRAAVTTPFEAVIGETTIVTVVVD